MSIINLKTLETYPISDSFVFYSDIDKFLQDYFRFKTYNCKSFDSRMDTQFYTCSINLERANIDRILYDLTNFVISMNEIIDRKIEIELHWTDMENYKESMAEEDDNIISMCYDCFHVMSKNEVEESSEYEILEVSELDDIEDLKHYVDSYNDKLRWLAYYRNKIKVEKLDRMPVDVYKEYIMTAFNNYIFIDISNENILLGISGNLYKDI